MYRQTYAVKAGNITIVTIPAWLQTERQNTK